MKVIHKDGSIEILEGYKELEVLRHTAAHITAQAIKRLYPDAAFAYGPATDKGFYYDVDLGDKKLTENDLLVIEAEMKKITRENLPIKPFLLSKDDAMKLMEERCEPYKVDHITDLPDDEVIGFYRQGDYIDMCRGPHLTYTKSLKAFKLMSVSGAYWKNDSKNKMLTRIYGTAFATQDELDSYLKMLDEAAKRDHRKIGKEMELFMLSDEGIGFPFFLPKGMILRNTLIEYWREIHTANNYYEISTPMMMNRSLWETSGHWEHYKDKMYITKNDDEDYCVKPMNCPGGILVYKNKRHSYRDFPLRVGELGLVHRHELKGTLHGLFRVRCLTQDDAHIFMRKDQISLEIAGVVRLINEVYLKFGFSYTLELSTRPEASMGSDEEWEVATNGLKEALNDLELPYEINEGDGAFYGPKIDFHLKDSIGRTWQCGTIQLDFQLPQNFDLTYTDENNQKQRPIMLHRVCFGSIERFIGILTEHYAGRFPVWLAPTQAKVLLVSKKSFEYGNKVYNALRNAGIRCELDDRDEKIGYMIREAQIVDRVPYILIIGQQESKNDTISVRNRDTSKTVTMKLEDFIDKTINEIHNRT